MGHIITKLREHQSYGVNNNNGSHTKLSTVHVALTVKVKHFSPRKVVSAAFAFIMSVRLYVCLSISHSHS